MIGSAPTGTPAVDLEDRFTMLLALADDNMVLAQRLGDWISRAPELEEDIALGNIALDHLGVARNLYTLAGRVEGVGRTEDDLAMLRDERQYLNLLLVEQPNGDFAQTMVRQLLFDAYQLLLWEALASDPDPDLSGIAARALKEARYHFRHSSTWVVRLGDGTEESHQRAQAGLDELWQFTDELFRDGLVSDRGPWDAATGMALSDGGLVAPDDRFQRDGGRVGFHSEHLGPLLAEMQWLQRSHPGLQW